MLEIYITIMTHASLITSFIAFCITCLLTDLYLVYPIFVLIIDYELYWLFVLYFANQQHLWRDLHDSSVTLITGVGTVAAGRYTFFRNNLNVWSLLHMCIFFWQPVTKMFGDTISSSSRVTDSSLLLFCFQRDLAKNLAKK